MRARSASAAALLLAALCVAGPQAARAGGPDAAAATDADVDAVDDVEDAEDVEDVEDVQPVAAAPATPGPSAGAPASSRVVGKLHPMLVHLPIAWIALLVVVDLLTFVGRRASWARAGWLLLGAVVLSLIPAVVTGLIRGADVESGGAAPELLRRLEQHETLAFVVAGLAAAALALRSVRRNQLAGAYKALYLLLLVALAGSVVVTAHFGGKLVFGESYLPF